MGQIHEERPARSRGHATGESQGAIQSVDQVPPRVGLALAVGPNLTAQALNQDRRARTSCHRRDPG